MTPDAPNYHLPSGTKITLPMGAMIVRGKLAHGYELMDESSGEIRGIDFSSIVDQLKLPGGAVDITVALTGNRIRHRLGGVSSAEALSDSAQQEAEFRVACCVAMQKVRAHLREESGNPRLELNWRSVEPLRRAVRDIAQFLLGEPIQLEGPRGGNKGGRWTLHKGRKLIEFLKEFENLKEGERPKDALVPLFHLQGRREPRIPHRLRELMTQAWEEIGLDLKGSSVANVLGHLQMLVTEENNRRRPNDLPTLIMPAAATLQAHRKQIVSETEYLVATKGERVARNRRGRGSTDIRALFIGEYVEIDECKASLVVSAKVSGTWEKLSDKQKNTLKEIDEIIQKRLHILVLIDVATRMVLAWVISAQPKAEATLQLFRMATRSKAREAQIYGCEGQAVDGVGIGTLKHDNGTGLRASTPISALVGMGAIDIVARAHAATDKPYVERMFGTIESVLLKLIHGYTGRKAGELPGYDAIANGVLDVDELCGILTRFFIDEYPSMRHTGFGMWTRRPIDVYNEINRARGAMPIDQHMRRIQLGWKVKATPSDEGVKVFGGIWFDSDEFQRRREDPAVKSRKVSVFVDPDDVNCATVVIQGLDNPIAVTLQTTVFADLTVPEVLKLMAECRKEDPQATQFYEDRIARARRKLFNQLRAIGVERKLNRSYSTVEECQRKAKTVFAGARIVRTKLEGTVEPGALTSLSSGPNVYQIGSGPTVIDGVADAFDPEASCDDDDLPGDIDRATAEPEVAKTRRKPPTASGRRSGTTKSAAPMFGRPANIKDLQ
ncbi:hypothetical protein QCN27_15525 [Cereibacter sp. SYSU M97828]|nr:hypothetical protein [Cereibacter flavus]